MPRQLGKEETQTMSDDRFQWTFIGVALLAIILIILAAVALIPSWMIVIAIAGGLIGDVALLHYWGKGYMSRY
jgi:hypothetical protein